MTLKEYLATDIIDRIEEARQLLDDHGGDIEVFVTDGVGIQLSDILLEAATEIKQLRK